MTKIEEIVEQIVDACEAASHSEAGTCEACVLAVARAVIEEAEKAGDELKIHPGIVGDHQPSKWRNSAIKMFQANIRALAAPSAGKLQE